MFALVEDLAHDDEPIDLDVIDAAFYWQCCRLDFIEAVEPLCVEFDKDAALLDVALEKVDAKLAQADAYLTAKHQLGAMSETQAEVAGGSPSNGDSGAVPSAPSDFHWDRTLHGTMNSFMQGHISELRALFTRGNARAEWGAYFDAWADACHLVAELSDKYDPQFDLENAVEYTPIVEGVLDLSRRFGLPFPAVMAYVSGTPTLLRPFRGPNPFGSRTRPASASSKP